MTDTEETPAPVEVVDNYLGCSNYELAELLRTVIGEQRRQRQQIAEVTRKVEEIASHLEEKDARRRNRIIRQGIPARFMREK